MRFWRAASTVALIGVLLSGCAHDVKYRMGAETGFGTGSITVLLTQPTKDLTMTVNGTLVAERAHTQKVTVTGIPAGSADVVIAAGAGPARVDRHVRVEVEAGKDTAIPVGAPEKAMSDTLSMGLLSAAAWVLSRALYMAFF
jgi:hypothetical protein